MTFPAALAAMSEKEWSAQVAQLAKTLGWRRYHTYRSERSEPGWPDEALVRDRFVLLELKAETGRLSGAQRDWLAALTAAGVEAYVARPSDLEALAAVLQAHTRPDGSLLEQRTRAELAP